MERERVPHKAPHISPTVGEECTTSSSTPYKLSGVPLLTTIYLKTQTQNLSEIQSSYDIVETIASNPYPHKHKALQFFYTCSNLGLCLVN